MIALPSERYGTCDCLPHVWSDFQPGYGIIERFHVTPAKNLVLLRDRLSCGTEPWRMCERCGALITWNEWYAEVLA